MSEIWQTVLAILASVGGGGAIVLGLSAWLGKVWAQHFLIKETAELKEKEERLIKRLEQKNYISKVRFDAEFTIYRELCAATDNMVRASYLLFPEFFATVPASKNDLLNIYNERLQDAARTFKEADETLVKNGPFIPEELFLLFGKINTNCSHQISSYQWLTKCVKDDVNFSEEEKKECIQRADKIKADYGNLQAKLREYLKTLDVEQ